MQKFLLAVIGLAALLSPAVAFDTASYVPKGKVNSYTKINYTIVSRFGEYYRSPALRFVHIFKNGREEEASSYDPQNKLVDRMTFEYDEAGRRTKTEYRDSHDIPMHRTVTEYDGEGRILSETEFDSMGTLSGKTIYTYGGGKETQSFYDREGALLSRIISRRDEAGRISEINEYFGDGSFEQKEVYSYLEDGKISSIIISIDDEGTSSSIIYRYTDNGILQEIQTFNAAGEVTHREFYEHDEQGNMTAIKEYEVTKKFGDIANELKSMTTYAYDYQTELDAKK